MSTEVYSQVLYSDGEGIYHSDLNDGGSFVQAVIWDKLVESLIGNVSNVDGVNGGSINHQYTWMNGRRGVNAPTHLAYCLSGGSAYPRKGTTNSKVGIAPGVLMQKVANSDGSAPTLLAYAFNGTEEVTIANGDATNPRVDIIQMKLELINGDSQSRDFKDATTGVVTSVSTNKKKYVQCTLSVKQGTPAASPVYPDPDTGYVCVAGVVVGATWAGGSAVVSVDTAGAVIVLHDQRMPVNVVPCHSSPATMTMVTAWAVDSNGAVVSASNATNELRIFSPVQRAPARLVGFGLKFVSGSVTAGTSFFQRGDLTGGTLTPNNLQDFTPTTSTSDYPYWMLEAAHAPAAGPTVQASATNKIAPPLWATGRRTADPSLGLVDANDLLMYKFVSGNSNTKIAGVTWAFAMGI